MVHYADDSTANDFGTDISVFTQLNKIKITKSWWMDECKWITSKYYQKFFSLFFFLTRKMFLCLTLVLEDKNPPMISSTEFPMILIDDQL